MIRRVACLLVIGAINCIPLNSQIATMGDRNTPLRALSAQGNVGISNATLLDQEARVLRVVVDANGTRAVHQHDDVQYHLFIPVTGPMELNVDGKSLDVKPWQPYLMKRGTPHGFHNNGSAPVEILEVFIK